MKKTDFDQQLHDIQKALEHIESLLQRIPELIAAAAMIELERKERLQMENRKYSDSVEICPINHR